MQFVMRNRNPTTIILYFIIAFFATRIMSEDDWNQNHRLRKDLLKNYDKMALPQRGYNSTVTVKVHLMLISVRLDEETQIMTINSILIAKWNDERLKWDYKDYGWLSRLHVGDNEIWKPDLHVYNTAEISEIDHYGNVHLLVYESGNVLWIPPATFKVDCSMDLKMWPHDEHECSVFLAAWTSSGWQINLEQLVNTTNLSFAEMVKRSGVWQTVKAEQRRHVEYYSEPYISMVYTIKVRRNAPTFVALTFVPAIVLPLFLLIQFLLPVDHAQRFNVGAVCALFGLMEMIFLKLCLPKLSTTTPLVVKYFCQYFVVSILTTALSAFLNRLSHPQNPLLSFPPPEILRRVLTGPISVVLCLQFHASKVGLSGTTAEDGEILANSTHTSYSHEWLLIAKVVDRISLIVYLCLTFISFVAYIAPLG